MSGSVLADHTRVKKDKNQQGGEQVRKKHGGCIPSDKIGKDRSNTFCELTICHSEMQVKSKASRMSNQVSEIRNGVLDPGNPSLPFVAAKTQQRALF